MSRNRVLLTQALCFSIPFAAAPSLGQSAQDDPDKKFRDCLTVANAMHEIAEYDNRTLGTHETFDRALYMQICLAPPGSALDILAKAEALRLSKEFKQ
jgi:hypothetical protein